MGTWRRSGGLWGHMEEEWGTLGIRGHVGGHRDKDGCGGHWGDAERLWEMLGGTGAWREYKWHWWGAHFEPQGECGKDMGGTQHP